MHDFQQHLGSYAFPLLAQARSLPGVRVHVRAIANGQGMRVAKGVRNWGLIPKGRQTNGACLAIGTRSPVADIRMRTLGIGGWPWNEDVVVVVASDHLHARPGVGEIMLDGHHCVALRYLQFLTNKGSDPASSDSVSDNHFLANHAGAAAAWSASFMEMAMAMH